MPRFASIPLIRCVTRAVRGIAILNRKRCIMTTQVKPVSKTVKKAVNRQKSWRRHLAPVMTVLSRLCLLTLVVGACIFGVFCLWSMAMDDPRFRMDGETLALAGAVRECPESIGELQKLGRSFGGRSLLDPKLISDMEVAYGNCVWIKKITQMRRRFPNRVELEFLLRIPAAQVWHNQRYWMVDSEGTLLPVAGSPQPFPNLPEIVGVTAKVIDNRPMPGQFWTDEGVAGALGILRAFWGSPLAETMPVARVVVNTGVFTGADQRQREIRRRFEVVTDSGAVIRWGTFNSGDVVGELTSSEKLYQLQELLMRDEALRPGVCFDVRTRLPGFTLTE